MTEMGGETGKISAYEIKSWHDGLFKSGLAMSAAAGLIEAFPHSRFSRLWRIGAPELSSSPPSTRRVTKKSTSLTQVN
jgi:hypothetical protein